MSQAQVEEMSEPSNGEREVRGERAGDVAREGGVELGASHWVRH